MRPDAVGGVPVDFFSLIPMLPELALAVLSLCLLLIGVFRGDDGTEMLTGLTVVCLATVAVMTIGSMWAADMKMIAFGGIFVSSPFTAFIKVIVLAAAAISLTISLRYMQTEGMYRIEFPVLVALATLGMMLMVSAGSLLMLYVGLELQSLALYVLAAFRRDSERSSEAGLKYFVLGALASGLLLYGISLVYGFTGSIDFVKIADALDDGSASEPAIILGLSVHSFRNGLQDFGSALPYVGP
jgi:NADH-quinone oxidoreductase subunit N